MAAATRAMGLFSFWENMMRVLSLAEELISAAATKRELRLDKKCLRVAARAADSPVQCGDESGSKERERRESNPRFTLIRLRMVQRD